MFSAFFPKQHCRWWGLSSLIREGWERRRVDSIWASSGLPYGRKESIKASFPQNQWEVILGDFTYKGCRWRWWFAVNGGIVTETNCNSRTCCRLQIQRLVIQSFSLESLCSQRISKPLTKASSPLKKKQTNQQKTQTKTQPKWDYLNPLLDGGNTTVAVILVSDNLKIECMWSDIVWYYSQSHSRTQDWHKTHGKFLYKLMQKQAFNEGLP